MPTVSVAAIVVDPADSQHLWIGDRTKPVIYESSDGGETWESKDLFAVTHINGVFRLKGNRWRNIAEGLPDMEDGRAMK